MAFISKEEKDLLEKYIHDGYESESFDYKEIQYKLTNTHDYYDKNNSVKSKFDVVKDVLSFLNIDAYKDKCIIMGVADDRKVLGVIEPHKNYEADLIQHLNSYIDPQPKIEVFRYPYENGDKVVDLIIIKVKSENINFPYLLSKDISNGKVMYTSGNSFIRSGNSTRTIRRADWDRFIKLRENSLISVLSVDLSEKMEVVSPLISILDNVAIKQQFELFSKKEKSLKEKLVAIIGSFQSFSDKGMILQADEKQNNSNINLKYFDEMINEGIKSYPKVSILLDNGMNSQLIRIFIFSYFIHKLQTYNDICELHFDSNSLLIRTKQSVDSLMKYNELKETVDTLIQVFDELKNYPGNNYYSDLIKIVAVSFEDVPDDEKRFLNFEPKFTVSNNIIPLLIEPLYGKDSYFVGFRELVQNAIDACKEKKNDAGFDYNPKVDILLEEVTDDIDNSKVRLTITDNGIGMSRQILKEQYFRVGESKKRASGLGLVGKFGVGVLSGFLLGDKIDVTTKSDKDMLFTFSIEKKNYIYVKEDDNINPKLDINGVESTDGSGTCIIINLNSSIDSIDDAYYKLGIDKWCSSESVNLNLIKNGNVEVLPSIADNRLQWIELFHEDSITMRCCDYDQLLAITDEDFEVTKKFVTENNCYVSYNDLLVPLYKENFKGHQRHIKIDKIPFVDIKDTNIEEYNGIKIPLSRKYIRLSGDMHESLVNYVYEKSLKQLTNLEALFQTGTFNSDFLKPILLVYTTIGYGIYCEEFLDKLKKQDFKEIITIYTDYNHRIDKNTFEDKKAYIFIKAYNFNKSDWADKIEYSGGLSFAKNSILKDYFINPNSRMRIRALVSVFNDFLRTGVFSGDELPKDINQGDLYACIENNVRNLNDFMLKDGLDYISLDNTKSLGTLKMDNVLAIRINNYFTGWGRPYFNNIFKKILRYGD